MSAENPSIILRQSPPDATLRPPAWIINSPHARERGECAARGAGRSSFLGHPTRSFRADELATPRSGAPRPPRGPRRARPRETTFTRQPWVDNRVTINADEPKTRSTVTYIRWAACLRLPSKVQQTVNHVLGLLCQRCPWPFTVTPQRGQSTRRIM